MPISSIVNFKNLWLCSSCEQKPKKKVGVLSMSELFLDIKNC